MKCKDCKYGFAHQSFDSENQTPDTRVVSYHCDKDGMLDQALAHGEDDIVFKVWLGDNYVSAEMADNCQDYEKEEE